MGPFKLERWGGAEFAQLKKHWRRVWRQALPGREDKWTPPALVSGGRRAHRGPAAASCTSLAAPRSASRWHSRRRGGRWRCLRLHSAPSNTVARKKKTFLRLNPEATNLCYLPGSESADLQPRKEGLKGVDPGVHDLAAAHVHVHIEGRVPLPFVAQLPPGRRRQGGPSLNTQPLAYSSPPPPQNPRRFTPGASAAR